MNKILILDDEQILRQSLVDYFEDRMWLAVEAKSGADALALLKKERPVAAIVDIRLPGMDGNEFIREAYQRGFTMVFVICTGSPQYNLPDDLQALPCVANRVFKKPVADLSELEQEVIATISGMADSAAMAPEE